MKNLKETLHSISYPFIGIAALTIGLLVFYLLGRVLAYFAHISHGSSVIEYIGVGMLGLGAVYMALSVVGAGALISLTIRAWIRERMD